MKKTLLFLMALAATSFGAANIYTKALYENNGGGLALFGATVNTIPKIDAVINLDTAEVDTGYYVYDLTGRPVRSATDTIGFVHFSSKDSTGTDSVGVRVLWQGNSRADGLGVWAWIDSVTYSSTSAPSAYTNATPTPVVNSKGYMSVRFLIRNFRTSAVGLKASVKDVVLNRRSQVGWGRQ